MRAAIETLAVAACALAILFCAAPQGAAAPDEAAVRLPDGVEAVWGLDKAYRQATTTRERIWINGLWRWQPAGADADAVPAGGWGYFKVPGCWPGITDYMQKDCQTVFAHPSWKDGRLGDVTAAWYQREITVPAAGPAAASRSRAEYLNSFAAVYVDGQKAGEMRFPGGEVDLTAVVPAGREARAQHARGRHAAEGRHDLLQRHGRGPGGEGLGGAARPLRRRLPGRHARRAARIGDVRVDTSVRKWRDHASTRRSTASPPTRSTPCRRRSRTAASTVAEFTSQPFRGGDLKDGRIAVTETWQPEKLWDINTPAEHVRRCSVSLLDAGGQGARRRAARAVRLPRVLDRRPRLLPERQRIFLSAVPLDNAQVGAALATYDAARESLQRLKSFGINFVYTHNYGCEPGAHLSFDGDPPGRRRRGHARRLLAAALRPLRLEGPRRRPRPTATPTTPRSTSAWPATTRPSCSTRPATTPPATART